MATEAVGRGDDVDDDGCDASAKAAQAGGKMEFKEMWAPNVVVDRELITGQNPFSDELLAEKLLQQLNSQSN